MFRHLLLVTLLCLWVGQPGRSEDTDEVAEVADVAADAVEDEAAAAAEKVEAVEDVDRSKRSYPAARPAGGYIAVAPAPAYGPPPQLHASYGPPPAPDTPTCYPKYHHKTAWEKMVQMKTHWKTETAVVPITMYKYTTKTLFWPTTVTEWKEVVKSLPYKVITDTQVHYNTDYVTAVETGYPVVETVWNTHNYMHHHTVTKHVTKYHTKHNYYTDTVTEWVEKPEYHTETVQEVELKYQTQVVTKPYYETVYETKEIHVPEYHTAYETKHAYHTVTETVTDQQYHTVTKCAYGGK